MDALVGTWAGEGRGHYPTIADFAYREEVELFRPPGKPVLVYRQRTWSLDDGRPLHGESGYLRFTGDGDVVEGLIAHQTGHVEVSAGTWDGRRLALSSTRVEAAPTAKEVLGLVRSYRLDGDVLHYTLAMSAVGHPMTDHLEGELRRTSG